MSYRTVEVELDNGRVRAREPEALPAKARALLTVLDSSAAATALTCGELAERWAGWEKLPTEEADAFADDIERARASLPSLKPAWD